jgi:hypothetical protein
MSGRKNIRVVLSLAAAALFVMAFAYEASAFSAGGSTPFTYTGNIVATDSANNIISVQAGPDDVLSFRLNADDAVMSCNMPGSFSDLKIGEMATVSYFEEGTGNYVANEVDLLESGMRHC